MIGERGRVMIRHRTAKHKNAFLCVIVVELSNVYGIPLRST